MTLRSLAICLSGFLLAASPAFAEKPVALVDRVVNRIREEGKDSPAGGYRGLSTELSCRVVPTLLGGRTEDETGLREILKSLAKRSPDATEAEKRAVLAHAFTMLTVPARFEKSTLESARSVISTISPEGFQIASAELEQLPKRPGLWAASARATLLSSIYDPDLEKPLRAAARALVCDPLASTKGNSQEELSRMELSLVLNISETLASFQETELHCEEMADYFSLQTFLLEMGRFHSAIRQDAQKRSAALQYRLPGTPLVGLFGRLRIKSGLDAGWESLSREPVLYLGFWCVSCPDEKDAIRRAKQLKELVGGKVRIVVVIAAMDADEKDVAKIREQCGDDLQLVVTDNDKWEVDTGPVILLSNDRGVLTASKIGVPSEADLQRFARKIQGTEAVR